MPASPYARLLILFVACAVSTGCDSAGPEAPGPGTAPSQAYTLSGHIAPTGEYDEGRPVLTDLPLGGGPMASPNTSCGFGPADEWAPVYLQEGSFSIQEGRFSLRLAGGQWSDGSGRVLEIGGTAVASGGTVWELYPDGEDQRYVAVFAPEGRGPHALTVLLPRFAFSPDALLGCVGLRFEGPRAEAQWDVTSGTHDLTGIESTYSSETLGLNAVIHGNGYGYTTLEAGELTFAADGTYGLDIETRTHASGGSSYAGSNTSTGRYATSGSSFVLDYDQPTITVALRSYDGVTLFRPYQAHSVPGRMLHFAP